MSRLDRFHNHQVVSILGCFLWCILALIGLCWALVNQENPVAATLLTVFLVCAAWLASIASVSRAHEGRVLPGRPPAEISQVEIARRIARLP
ncbi:MAG: hypothetical protein PHS14_13010 [Elusimicrobia bacterium]|nr:hypothetical protein [Elusimicrobiota bacterium]